VRLGSSFAILRFLPEVHTRCVLAFVYTLPLSVIVATTSQQLGLNVIAELIIGYALPGRPIAMMLFKTWGHITMNQAIMFLSDFKLAHYMKIAHRPMFFCQVVATIVAGTVQLGVQTWMFSNIEGFCDADQKDGFICPYTTLFGNASIIVSKLVVLAHFSYSVAQRCCIAVGCHWAATSIVTRTALLWPCFLLPCRNPCTIVPVDIAQEVWNRFLQVHPFPSHLLQRGRYTSCEPP
jgi:OPT family oligopeptide transporter